MQRRTFVLTAGAAAAAAAAQSLNEVRLDNGHMRVTLLPSGARISSVVLADDKTGMNPLWDPGPKNNSPALGHFPCLDGFGSPSPEERAAGFPGHGEAVRCAFEAQSQSSDLLVLTGTLPLAQERVTRTFRLPKGSNALWVRTKVESLLSIDRPIAWAEHATIGSPFLEPRLTVVDVSGTRSQTRPYTAKAQHRLASNREFTWPNAPLTDGSSVDIRAVPPSPDSGDHTTTVVTGDWAFVSAIHTTKNLLVAWIWKAADFPWLQNWESYPNTGRLARGLEFSTQPFDLPRRQVVQMHRLLDTPTYRWLPAKSTIETEFAMVWTRVPEGFSQVARISSEGGRIALHDASGRSVPISAPPAAG